MTHIFDKRGRPIECGDILRVYHFTDARGKRHYMTKQALEIVMLGKHDPTPWLKISHLNRLDNETWEIGTNYYVEQANGRRLMEVEIIDSLDGRHDERAALGSPRSEAT